MRLHDDVVKTVGQSDSRYILDAACWPDLVSRFGIFEVVTAIRQYYSECMARKMKELSFNAFLLTTQARILELKPDQKIRHQAIRTIDRIITRLEFFHQLHTYDLQAAEAGEADALDADLPPKLRKSRKAAAKKQAENDRLKPRQHHAQGSRGAPRGRGSRGRGGNTATATTASPAQGTK